MLKKSFTLIEILVVLSLLLVVVAITAPRSLLFNNYLLSYELEKLFITFTYLQQKAIAGNKKLVLEIDQTNNKYSFSFQNSPATTENLSDHITFGFIKGVMGPPSNPSKKIEKSINLEHIINNSNSQNNSSIKFWPNGRITPCTIYLCDKLHKYMGALTCSVSQVSYIRRYICYNFKWEILKN